MARSGRIWYFSPLSFVHFAIVLMAEGSKNIKVCTRVEVVGKGVVGTVAYIGSTLFSGGGYMFRLQCYPVFIRTWLYNVYRINLIRPF